MNRTELAARYTTLDALCSAIVSREIDAETTDFSDLPTYGGAEPTDTTAIWSWDETRLLVGDDHLVMIVRRADWRS